CRIHALSIDLNYHSVVHGTLREMKLRHKQRLQIAKKEIL
ncbi:MAG: hypothetical protein ACJAXX_001016, partial [Roseivirga sp.]